MSDTQRSIANMPKELDCLTKLVDLDLSYNQLVRIPEPIFEMRTNWL